MQTLRKLDASLGAILEEGAKIMFWIFSCAALIVCLGYQIQAASFPYQLDYGEAPLVDQAMRLAAGKNIYRTDLSTPPYTISNYPPLYVVFLAPSVKFAGPATTFLIGRIISILSIWAAAVFAALLIHTQTRNRFAAGVGGAILLAFPYVVTWSPLLRIDSLALAFSLGGLAMLAAYPNSTKHLILASFLLVAAIYTRQSYALAAPLAGFVWLLSHDWRKALHLILLVGGCALILFLILTGATHGGFHFNIVTANVNEFRMDNLEYHWKRLQEIAMIPLLFGGLSFFLIRRLNPLWTLASPYLFGAAISAATIGKIGSNVNYLLELCAALGLAAGVVIAASQKHLPILTARAVLLIALALGVGRMLHFTLKDYTADLLDRRATIGEISKLSALVAETPGDILIDEYMGMLTLQRRPLVIQPFEVTQLAWADKWDQTPLLESIENKEFAAIIIYDKPWADERWTEEMFDAINRSYMLTNIVAGNKVYMAFQHKPAAEIRACPGAAWQLPSAGTLGIKRRDEGLDFFGWGNEGKVPVYAVADGLLTRLPGRSDAVVIQHDDPLKPGNKVWSYYADMTSANGMTSFVAHEFPPGSGNVPVKAGQLIGYQGTWSGRSQWPMWLHVHFAVVSADQEGGFPENVTVDKLLDPTLYLGLLLEQNPNTQPMSCRQQ
jgi:hypothetical protein